jgi:GNAT superfamily N-acetyltransferase
MSSVAADRSPEVSFTREGVPYVIRPISADDKEALLEAFGHLSEESRYSRFLRPITRLTRHDLRYFTEVDHVDHEALIAVAPSGDLIRVARYIRLDQPETAEVAVTVADEWQQRGIGSQLLRSLASRATDASVGSFVGVCLADNARMLELLRELGSCRATRSVGGTKEFEVVLPTDAGTNLVAALGTAAGHCLLSR